MFFLVPHVFLGSGACGLCKGKAHDLTVEFLAILSFGFFERMTHKVLAYMQV